MFQILGQYHVYFANVSTVPHICCKCLHSITYIAKISIFQILQGFQDTAQEAGCLVTGGQTVIKILYFQQKNIFLQYCISKIPNFQIP